MAKAKEKLDLDIYFDQFGEWRWRIMKGNKVITSGTRGFAQQKGCYDDMRWLRDALSDILEKKEPA